MGRLLGRERLWGSSRVSRWLGGVARGLLGVAGGAGRAPCAQNDKINVLHEPYFGTHILGNHLPFQTSEIPKKNTKPLISIRGLAFDKLLQSSEK